MAIQELFDKGRRKRIHEALRRGDVGGLIRRRMPEVSGFNVRFGNNQDLPLGMLVQISGIGFRFMGSDNGYAVIKIEGPGYDGSEPIRLKAGKRKGIGVDCGNGPQNFVLTVLETTDPSGQTVITAQVTEMLEK